MSKTTKIQWCDGTVNPTMGCDGCELRTDVHRSCYAGALHDRFGGRTKGYAPSFEQVTPFPGRMQEAASWGSLLGKSRVDKPWLNQFPRLIFVSDMSDSLSSAVSFGYLLQEVICNVVSARGVRHEWLWLTKRPNRMAEFSQWLGAQGFAWPRNLWAGTSVTSQATASRIGHLAGVGDAATIRFVSVEPQIEPIGLEPWLKVIDWLIQGGESGKGARAFDVEWAFDLARQCAKYEVPYFLKQLGSNAMSAGRRLKLSHGHGGDWAEWPALLQVRNMPSVRRLTVGNSSS